MEVPNKVSMPQVSIIIAARIRWCLQTCCGAYNYYYNYNYAAWDLKYEILKWVVHTSYFDL